MLIGIPSRARLSEEIRNKKSPTVKVVSGDTKTHYCLESTVAPSTTEKLPFTATASSIERRKDGCRLGGFVSPQID